MFHTFDHKQRETNLAAENKWDEIDIAYGVAVFDPDIDNYLTDTVNRADKSMYDNKAKSKAKSKSETEPDPQ